MPLTTDQFGKGVVTVGVMTADELQAYWKTIPAAERPKEGTGLAAALVRSGQLTSFQANEILAGRGGNLAFGDYLIVDLIGAGGMGKVYRARHRHMKRIVAIKVMSAQSIKDEAAVRRFKREVEAAARLEHPNIVTAFDARQDRGIHYLVMQFVDGRDLSNLVKARGPLPVDEALDYIRQAATGLAYAHAEGVIHRDIKPANLLVDKKRGVKILDMGLARFEEGGEALTATEQVMGTVDYMSPEQAANTHGADARADVYSLGCTLWYLLTASKVYEGDTMIARIIKHRDGAVPSLRERRPEIPEGVDLLFQRMVAKQPDQRPVMAEVAAALESYRTSGTISLVKAAAVASPTAGQSSAAVRGSAGGQGSAASFLPPSATEFPSSTAEQDGATAIHGNQKLRRIMAPDLTHSYINQEHETDPKSQFAIQGSATTRKASTTGGVPPWKSPWALVGGGAAAVLLVALGIWLATRGKKADEVSPFRLPEVGSANVPAADAVPNSGSAQAASNAPALIRPGDKPATNPTATPSTSSTASVAPSSPPRQTAAPATTNPQATMPGFVPLFNGKDLTGWVAHDGDLKQWKVVDGYLTATGKRNHLYTIRDNFSNFHLYVEARANNGGNGGVYFRCTPGKDGKPDGFEAQIDSNHADAQRTGSLYNLVPISEQLVPPDEWFTMEVIAEGRQVRIRVNGKQVVDYTDSAGKWVQGALALQHFGDPSRVDIRKIDIKIIN